MQPCGQRMPDGHTASNGDVVVGGLDSQQEVNKISYLPPVGKLSLDLCQPFCWGMSERKGMGSVRKRGYDLAHAGATKMSLPILLPTLSPICGRQ